MSIVKTSITGNYDYRAAYVGTPDTDSSNAARRRAQGACPLFAMKGVAQSTNNNTITVVVESGVPFLFGAATTDTGGFPHGSIISLTDPNGQPVQGNQTTDDLLVVMNGSSVQIFFIANPTPGTWTLTAQNLPSSDAHVFMSTLPTQDVYATMIAALQPEIDEKVAGVTETDDSWTCWACTVGAWVIGLAIAAIVAVALTALTVSSGAVIALAAFLTISAPYALAALVTLIAVVTGTVEIMVANFCAWTGACDKGVITASIAKPSAGGRISGNYQLQANTTGSTANVVFFVDSTNIGTNPGSTPYHMNCDTTAFSNGPHTIGALAISSSNTTSLAPPVNAIFNN